MYQQNNVYGESIGFSNGPTIFMGIFLFSCQLGEGWIAFQLQAIVKVCYNAGKCNELLWPWQSLNGTVAQLL